MEVPPALVAARPAYSRPAFAGAPPPPPPPPPAPRAQASAPPRPAPARPPPAREVRSAGGGGGAGAGAEARRRPPAARPARPARGEAPDLLPNAVLVTGYPPYTKPQDLAYAFCKFGAVRLDPARVTAAAACLEFRDPATAQAAIRASRGVNVYGAFLTVTACPASGRPRRPPRKREPRAGRGHNFKGTMVDPAHIPLQGAFSQQLEALLAAVRLTPPEIQRLAMLYRDLECVLRELWPGCRAIPFGSVTTGLGVKSSDADCFVSGVCGAGAGAGGAANAVGRARRALAAHPHVFGELLAIPRANTPIVKFLHRPTGVYCDLSFKTPLGAQNSKLIAFLLQRDARLVPVAVALKYWARVHDLTGTGKLTNYALTMMIIFYFQRPPRALLPAVEWLQRDRSYDCLVDHWNTGFMSDARRLPAATDAASVADLLGEFFDFYAKFDFENLVVCPFLGRAIKKDDFRDPRLLPEEFGRYRSNVRDGAAPPLRVATPVCVQDPFEQCHNVASPVSARLAADIVAHFQFAAAAHERERARQFAGLLPAILLERPALPRGKRGGTEFRARLPPGLLAHVAAPDWRAAVRHVALQLFQTLLRVQLRRVDDDGASAAPGEGTRPEGAAKLGNNPEDASKLGRETSKSDVGPEQRRASLPEETPQSVEEAGGPEPAKSQTETVKSGDPEGKGEAPKEKSKVEIIKNGKMRERERYSGALTRAIWKRKMFSKLYSVMGLSFSERETRITDEILQADKNVIDVRFTLALTFVAAPRSAALAVRHAAGDLNAFKEFGKFFSSTFQHWFAILSRPSCGRPLPGAAADEQAAADELHEALERDDDSDESDSDSDSSFSYEDERIDPNAADSEVAENEGSARSASSLSGDADKNSKNESNSVVKKQSENEKKSGKKENYDNKVQTDKIPDEDAMNASDKSPRRRKNKKRQADRDISINRLNDRVEALTVKSSRTNMNNMRNHDKTHQQQTADDQYEGKESQNAIKNKNRSQHGDHNDTGQEIAKSKSTRHRPRKGRDKTQGAPAEESGRTGSAGENGQMPSC